MEGSSIIIFNERIRLRLTASSEYNHWLKPGKTLRLIWKKFFTHYAYRQELRKHGANYSKQVPGYQIVSCDIQYGPSNAQLCPPTGGQLQLADTVIWNRNATHASTLSKCISYGADFIVNGSIYMKFELTYNWTMIIITTYIFQIRKSDHFFWMCFKRS